MLQKRECVYGRRSLSLVLVLMFTFLTSVQALAESKDGFLETLPKALLATGEIQADYNEETLSQTSENGVQWVLSSEDGEVFAADCAVSGVVYQYRDMDRSSFEKLLLLFLRYFEGLNRYAAKDNMSFSIRLEGSYFAVLEGSVITVENHDLYYKLLAADYDYETPKMDQLLGEERVSGIVFAPYAAVENKATDAPQNDSKEKNGILDAIAAGIAGYTTQSPEPVALEPTVTSTIPPSMKESYQLGDKGEDISEIKQALQSLGYYRYGTKPGVEYNEVMQERVALFQETNGLPVTGIIDHQTLTVLFSGNAKATTAFATATPRPTNTPKPTPTPYVEPKYAAEETGWGNWGTSYGTPWISTEVKNTSREKTIDGITLRYYATDVYGTKMKGYGYGDKEYDEIINITIKPGKKKYTPKIKAYQFEGAKKIFTAIVKVHFTDGTTVTYPQSQYSWWRWEY